MTKTTEMIPGVTVTSGAAAVAIDLEKHGEIGKFAKIIEHFTKEYGNKRILYMWTVDRRDKEGNVHPEAVIIFDIE